MRGWPCGPVAERTARPARAAVVGITTPPIGLCGCATGSTHGERSVDVDAETRNLRRVLRERDKLRARLLANDRELTRALQAWSDSRPGCRGGIATEAGARYLLGQAGLL